MTDSMTDAITTAFAAAALPPDLAAVYAENGNHAKFTHSDGTPDPDAIAELATRIAAHSRPLTPPPNLHQGRQGTPSPSQLSRDDLAGMSTDEITEARDNGQLDDLMKGPN